MKLFCITFFLVFFTALGFSANPDKKWILGDFYFNVGDSPPNFTTVNPWISYLYTLSEGQVYISFVYDQSHHPDIWANVTYNVGLRNYRSSASQYNEYDVYDTSLRLNPDFGVYNPPVWVGSPQTGQTILQGQTKYLNISSFSPSCSDYTFSSSGGQVSRVGSVLSVSASASTSAISGSFKALKDGVWSDDVPFSFTVLKSSLITPLVIKENGINPLETFDSDLGATNYLFKDVASGGNTFNQSSTGSTVNTSTLPKGTKILASAYDSQGNLVQEKVVTVVDNPVSNIPTPQTSQVFLPNQIAITSPSFVVTKSGEPVYQAVTNSQVGGVIYSLDPNNPSSKYLSINSRTGVVTGSPPTGEYQFDVIASGYAISSVTGQIDMEKSLTNKKTVYATQQDVVNPVSSAVIASNNIQAEQANNTQSIINNQYSQTQVFNDMTQLLQTISSNTSVGSNPDMSAIVDAINTTNQLLGGSVPASSMDAEVDKDALAVRPNLSVSSVTSVLHNSYDNSAPVLIIPLHLCNVGSFTNFEDYQINFSEGNIGYFVGIIRLFFLGGVVLYFAIQTIKLFRSFES
ncbi:MAG: hypothetical protein WCP69_15545 [Bacteroidota bacterium]